ncbi:DUF4230 domain-containing protein [Fibrobacter succinogenes]|uniref:DUF4230 domain-containing protein n=1 Tax=Fibrobacter succinogenes TaxID=833 RepID=A0A380S6V8_FIBSU|nr:DUF4230 domain-containing protein [Fibrobacter succinogenes]PWJ35556.1 uncharacterized protein DUF4230 [Fibrobacter succinogenes subsp. elongatus]SUQ24211.1 Protein of unknown function [Fibrobacter succinogenes]
MKPALKIIAILLIICVTSVTTALVMKKLYADTKRTSITSEFVEQQISEISELATLHHHYRKNANYQDAKKLLEYMPDWRINKSIKEFSLVYEGDVKLGYNLKDIKILVEPNTQSIFIYLPEPKILSHSIDFESIQILWEKQGWFNNIRFEDFKQFFISEQKKYEQENSEELKRRAREHAMKLIQLRLGTTIEHGYKVNLEQRE